VGVVGDRAGLLGALLADLAAEGEALDAVVAELEDSAWLTPTPAEGWTIAHQIAHLAWTDERALEAVREPDRFAADSAGIDLGAVVFEAAARGSVRTRSPCSPAGGPVGWRWRSSCASCPKASGCPGTGRR
jgi:uncharacterized protein (TIGR03083 family)